MNFKLNTVIYDRYYLVSICCICNAFITVMNGKFLGALGGVINTNNDAAVIARLYGSDYDLAVDAYTVVCGGIGPCRTRREQVYRIGRLIKQLSLGKNLGQRAAEYAQVIDVATAINSRQIEILRIQLTLSYRVEAMTRAAKQGQIDISVFDLTCVYTVVDNSKNIVMQF